MLDARTWFVTLTALAPDRDRTLLEVIAGLLARDTMPPDVLPRVRDALEHAYVSARDAGHLLEAVEWGSIAEVVANEARRPRPGFW